MSCHHYIASATSSPPPPAVTHFVSSHHIFFQRCSQRSSVSSFTACILFFNVYFMWDQGLNTQASDAATEHLYLISFSPLCAWTHHRWGARGGARSPSWWQTVGRPTWARAGESAQVRGCGLQFIHIDPNLEICSQLSIFSHLFKKKFVFFFFQRVQGAGRVYSDAPGPAV